MLTALKNRFLVFHLDLDNSAWGVEAIGNPELSIRQAQMRAEYRTDHRWWQALDNWKSAKVSAPFNMASPHGPMQALQIDLPIGRQGLNWTVQFALPDEHPLLLWRASLENQGHEPVWLERITMLETRVDGLLEPAFFSNGWASWDYTGVYGWRDRFQRSRLGPLTRPMRVNPGTPHPGRRGHFAADLFGVLGDRGNRRGLLAGYLSQCEHFGSVEARLATNGASLKMWANGDHTRLDSGARISTDWACLHFLNLDDPHPLDTYVCAAARQNGLSPDGRRVSSQAPQPATGWCSWYFFYQNLSAQDVQRNLAALQKIRPNLPLDLVQIDDGFQARAGDWLLFSSRFPAGVAPLAEEIHQAGFIPGLWLAPFILQRDARLAQEHPEWQLRGQFNCPVNAGFIWENFTTALDLSQPGALQYVGKVIDTAVHQWGFPYLKLDFLYAGALAGRRHDATLSRAQILRRGLELIRQTAGDEAFLLGCGCPLGSGLGIFDAMRIGPDVDVRWPARFKGIGWIYDQEPGVPSVRNAIHNTLTRSAMHRRWWVNDPDCLLLRPTTELTLDEVQSLATIIAFSGGLYLLSDELADLPAERLALAACLLPPIGQRPRLLDWFDAVRPGRLRLDLKGAAGDWHLLALLNWQDTPQAVYLPLADFSLPNGEYWVRSFWQQSVQRVSSNEIPLGEIAPHACAALAVRRLTPAQPQYLGSNLHISQGLEIENWTWDAPHHRLHFSIMRPGLISGHVDLYLPWQPASASADHRPLAGQWLSENCYRFPLAGDKRLEIELQLAGPP